jgi:2,4-dienoyl-CoA reductase-like NADH-dependent reductase (Old Yellow Enzyme family)
MDTSPLFRPLTIGSLSLPNRIVMAPMTRNFSDAGVPRAEVDEYYARRARAGTGLILTEGVVIDRPASKNVITVPNFHGAALDRWGEIVGAVHAAGGRIAPQLWHMGAAGYRDDDYRPAPIDSPSGIALKGPDGGSPMSEAAIADTIAAYANAAAAAVALGADAIELHGAHGYLIDQFFWPQTNQRLDGWGGESIAERTRFGAEVVRAVRAAVPADLPLSMRLSQWKLHHYDARLATTPAEMAAWLEPLAEAGVDIFHCSQRRYWEPEFAGSDLNFAGWAKKLTGKVTISVGSVGLDGDFIGSFEGQGPAPTVSIERLIERLDRGEFDLVSIGRAMIANPDWTERVRAGAFGELQAYDRALLASLI